MKATVQIARGEIISQRAFPDWAMNYFRVDDRAQRRHGDSST